MIWCCDEAPGFTPGRVQDRAFVGQHRPGDGRLRAGRSGRGADPAATRPTALIVIGSDGMMRGVQQARHSVLQPVPQARPPGDRQHQLADAVHDEGNLRAVPADAPDPVTGEETVVFSCFNQDQPLDHVRFRQPAHPPVAERRPGEAESSGSITACGILERGRRYREKRLSCRQNEKATSRVSDRSCHAVARRRGRAW